MFPAIISTENLHALFALHIRLRTVILVMLNQLIHCKHAAIVAVLTLAVSIHWTVHANVISELS